MQKVSVHFLGIVGKKSVGQSEEIKEVVVVGSPFRRRRARGQDFAQSPGVKPGLGT